MRWTFLLNINDFLIIKAVHFFPHKEKSYQQSHVWEHHQWRNQFCFRTHLRCFKVQLTPCVKSTRATSALAGLQCSTPRKGVANRSWSPWQLIFLWQHKSAHQVYAILSTQTLITISSHRIWVLHPTRHKGGNHGNTSGTRQMERSGSGSLDSATRVS